MAIYAREPERKFTPSPEGLHPAVCCDVVDLGLVKGPFGEKAKVELVWQLDAVNEETDKRFTVRRWYTNSLHEKSNLRRDLEMWRGRKFTGEELRGFDLEKLIGVSCQVQVIHSPGDDGKVWANVQAVIPLGKGMPKVRVGDGYVRVKDREESRGVGVSAVAEEPEDDPCPF